MEERPNSYPSSSFPSSSSSPLRPKKYDVFLSFRGEDTRHNFTSHLYAALCQKGIFYTFKDADELKKGKAIGPELMNAIEDSNYAVIILSENYATSSWCLKELTKIVECMGNSGRIRTIFYHVDPSNVRNVKSTEVEKQQKSSFWKALEKHAENPSHSKDLISSWKDALVTIANQAGQPVQYNMDEAKFVQDFITKLSIDLGASIKNLEGFVGMTPRLRQLDSHVLKSSSDVRFIGIHGMGGIGKSTLATAYYKRMSHKFEGSSFLRNVREVCEKKENGLVHLQKQLLAEILKGASPKIGDVGSGIDMIKSRLSRKKVLIVLDDVSKPEQLEALADSHKRKNGSDHDQLDKWFGSGSIIIVTTRNEGLLSQRYKIYRAEHLNPNEALELFSSKAFESNELPQDYKELSKQVVEYAEYLPLALNVMGSLLSSKKSINEWKGALRRLENYPAKEIVEKLEISYDDLEETDQRIFLDIACFFKGHKKDYVIPILDSCGFNSEYGISNLIERCLLEIQYGRNLWMRDLLQKMGHNIVRRESGKPGGPTRIWDVDDFKRFLLDKSGMENVEAIVLTFQEESISSSFEALSNMKKLRLLMVLGSFHVSQTDGSIPKLDYLSNNLRLLEWNRFPFKEFPSSFQPKKLVRLKLIKSVLQRLWENSIELPNLKVIDLSDSRSFSTFGNFSVVSNLEMLILAGCSKLSGIDDSITVLGKLTMLNLSNCPSLQMFPPSIRGLNSLKTLRLYGCSKLFKLPDDFGYLQSLKYLDVRKSGIRHLPSSINRIKNLETLEVSEHIESPSKNLETLKVSEHIESLSENFETLEVSEHIESPSKNLETLKVSEHIESPSKNLETLKVSEHIESLSKNLVEFLPFSTNGFSKMRYDVFLNFGIEAMDSGFALYLNDALEYHLQYKVTSKCHVLMSGEFIPEEGLLRAIEDSLCSIIILSESYAFSTWALTELVKIVECMESKGHIVLPIFYHMDPSHLYDPTGIYSEALTIYATNALNFGEIQSWDRSLAIVGNLPGWTLHQTDIEENFIQVFIEDISEILNNASNDFSKGLYEIDSRLYQTTINPTVGKASFSSDRYCSEDVWDKDDEIKAFTSLERHFQDPSGATKSFGIVVSESQIHPWFTKHYSTFGGLISIQATQNWFNSNWIGLAFFVCVRANPSNIVHCDMKLNDNVWKVRRMSYNYSTVGYFNQLIWIFYLPRYQWPVEMFQNSCVKLQFWFHSTLTSGEDCGPCGVRLVYKQDVEELNQSKHLQPSHWQSSGSSNNLRQNTASNESVSGISDRDYTVHRGATTCYNEYSSNQIRDPPPTWNRGSITPSSTVHSSTGPSLISSTSTSGPIDRGSSISGTSCSIM